MTTAIGVSGVTPAGIKSSAVASDNPPDSSSSNFDTILENLYDLEKTAEKQIGEVEAELQKIGQAGNAPQPPAPAAAILVTSTSGIPPASSEPDTQSNMSDPSGPHVEDAAADVTAAPTDLPSLETTTSDLRGAATLASALRDFLDAAASYDKHHMMAGFQQSANIEFA